MESWVIEVGTLVVSFIVGYVVLKQTVAQHNEKIKEIDKEFSEYKRDTEARLDAGVKRFEELQHQISQHLDKDAADKKYASKELLDLHIKNIEKDIKQVKESNAEMGKKLDKLIETISTNIVRTLTPHSGVFSGARE